MADDTSEIQFVGNTRERGGRTSLVDNARLGADYQARQDGNPGVDTGDESGYWDGNVYKTYFQLGVSKFGDGSVFK